MSIFKRASTYEGITAGLSRLVADLRALGDRHLADAEVKVNEAKMLNAEASGHYAEAVRARFTAAKVEGLLG